MGTPLKPTLLVLAAGMGSRYGGLKQIEPVGPGGESVLDYSVYDALRAGFGNVVFVIRRDIEKVFREAIGARFEGKTRVTYVFQDLDALPGGRPLPAGREKPWGTGHAILRAEKEIDEPFVVINADDFYGPDAYRKMGAYLEVQRDSTPASYAMVGFTLRETLSGHGAVARGICDCDNAGFLRRVSELTGVRPDGEGVVGIDREGRSLRLTGAEITSMNFWGFTPSLFACLREQFAAFLAEKGDDPAAEFYIPEVVDRLIETGLAKVKILTGEGPWLGVTYREDRVSVARGIKALVAKGWYPERLWD